MTIDYRPIACDRHSEFELLAMRRAQVDAQIEGEMETLRVRVCDLVTKDRAEYLVVELSDGVERRFGGWITLSKCIRSFSNVLSDKFPSPARKTYKCLIIKLKKRETGSLKRSFNSARQAPKRCGTVKRNTAETKQ
jgi:transcriptional antiterminator Rof (Rho-off)